MIAVFQIHQAITRKEEVSPPLQRFPVVCATIISTTNCSVKSFVCVEFILDNFLFKIFFNCCVCAAQDVLVYLFSESAVHLTLEGLGTVSVQELGQSVREALHIPDSAQDVFAFWLCSPLLGENFVVHTYSVIFVGL